MAKQAEQQLLEALGLKEEDKKDFTSWAISLEDECNAFYDFVDSHDKIKMVQRQIPAHVRLPKKLRQGMTLRDVQVGGKRREPDDAIYANNAKIRALIARGNTILSFQHEGNIHTCFPLYGMKKFTGGMGDDDDQDAGGDDVTWKKFFTKPSDQATHIISTSKENGSAAHLAALYVEDGKGGGEYVLICGSKNSHLICSLKHGEEDVSLFPESPWRVAKVIAKSIFDLFKQIGDENTLKFVSLLATWHLTAIFEMLDAEDQHIELLTNKTPMVRFITFTESFRGQNPHANELCIYPLLSVRVAEAYNIPTIQCEVTPLSNDPEKRLVEFNTLQNQIRGEFGNEGKVLYFATADNEVIGILKKKTLWYILLRALREKFKMYGTFVNRSRANKPTRFPNIEGQRDHIAQLITKRFKAIQKWLGFSDAYRDAWTTLGHAGNEWIYQGLKKKTLDDALLGHMFPVVWDKFITQTASSDHIPVDIK